VSAPLVSIVVPTRNGAATVPALLDAIAAQRAEFAFEVVAVDSESTDGTAELLKGRVNKLIPIAAAAFDHGLTRNLGIEHAAGELIVLIVQDAIPASDDWLTALTRPFAADPSLAGTFARQLPRAGASAIARDYLAHWAASSDVARVAAVKGPEELAALEPMDRLARCTFDNVCSCIRRSIWARHPFRATPIAEDLEWAKEVLLAGHRLAFVPEAAVFHSHDRSARYELARTYAAHRRLYELFGVRTIPSVPMLVRAFASSARRHLRSERSARAMTLAVAWPLGQYLGAMSAARGWKARRSSGV
jgi:rhamnosyltransferase